MAVTAEKVAAFLGKPGDAATLATAEQAIPIVTVMARAYVRGGEDDWGPTWSPNSELDAVIVTAAARLATNPGQLPVDTAAGPFSHSLRGAFGGWTTAELSVLNRYRKRAM